MVEIAMQIDERTAQMRISNPYRSRHINMSLVTTNQNRGRLLILHAFTHSARISFDMNNPIKPPIPPQLILFV